MMHSLPMRAAACFVALGLTAVCPAPVRAQVTDAVSVAFMQGKAPVAPDAIAALGPNLFGDNVNLFNGSFSFEQADFSLPGNNALPVAVVRSHTPGRSAQVRGVVGDWDLNTPRIEGAFPVDAGWVPQYGTAATRCSGFDAPPTVTRGGGGSTEAILNRVTMPTPPDRSAPVSSSKSSPSAASAGTDFFPWEYGAGINIVVPGVGSQEILKRSSGNSLAPTDGGSYPLVTSKNWQIGCLPSIQNGAGQGFTALSPDGVRYRFDWMATRSLPQLRKAGTALPRQDMFLMATQVTDRFGNWVKYTYDSAAPLNLKKIESSDGRVATLTYTGGRLSSATDGTRTWNYAYSGTGELSTVTLPDSSQWSFNLRPLVDPDSMIHDEYTDCDSMPMSPGGVLVGTITHPSGAVGTFSTMFLPHGRTNVTRACTYDNASGWTTGQIWPKTTTNQALISKQVSGPGMPTMTWSYSGDDNAPQGEWAPCNNCLDRKTVTVTEPSGARTRHTFGIKWHVNEGQLLRVEEGWDGSAALKTTDYTYRDAAGQTYLDAFGDSTYLMTDYLSSRNRPQSVRSIAQQGASFTWQADVSSAGFDAQARPKKVQKFSSLGSSRTELISYSDNLNLWVLGQTAQITEASTGKVIESHSYSPTTAQRTATSSFGWQSNTFSYYADGTLQTLYDAASHPTTFQTFMRGKPQRAVFADSSVASAVVNNLGNVASFTNEVNSTMGFGFDAMGRVSSITYPTGDGISYLPTNQSFAQINSPEYGLPAGHWRQIIATGNGTTIRWFDALWRVRLEQRYDAANSSGTSRFVETRYDAGGRKSFESYPVRSISAVDGSLTGHTYSYDDLNRVTRKNSGSELGTLTETTDYLSGFQRRVTNARGYATTTAFQAFDEPREDKPVLITAPEGVQVQIVRDLFGKASSITRSGNGVSVTRRYVYDAYERLCKTLDPETGATVQDYDAAGNLAWRAPGVNLPSTTSCDTASVAASAKISYGYNVRNRLTSTTYGDASPSITRDYWSDGLPKTVATSNGASWSYTFNARRLPTAEALTYGGQTYSFSRGYNNLGQQTSLTNPTGSPTLSYTPNALGEVTGITGYVSGVTYHPNGAVAGYTLANGIVHSLTQNTRGLPLVNKDAGVLQDQYGYDANGNVSSIADQQENIFGRSMGYDGLDRLTSANAPGGWGTATYGYDAVDNLRAAVVGSRTSTLSYDATNRLSSVITNGGTTLYGYDTRGNISSKGAQTYAFDLGNRLSSASVGGSYLYDGHGRRIRIASSDGSTRLQLYTQDGKLSWANSAGGTRPASSSVYIYLSGKEIAEWNSVGGVQYMHTDALGSPVAHSNAAGTLLNRTRFEPYGYPFAGTKPSANTSVIGFTGHVQDAETDLVYMQQRYYDPLAGRFLSNDPIAANPETGKSFNRYQYAENSPYGNSDPDGRQSVCTGTRISGACPSEGGISNSASGTSVSFAPPAVVTAAVRTGATATQAAGSGAATAAGVAARAAGVAGLALYSGEAGRNSDKITIYRAVSPPELANIRATGIFGPAPNGSEMKQFWMRPSDANDYTAVMNKLLGATEYTNVVSVLVSMGTYYAAQPGSDPINGTQRPYITYARESLMLLNKDALANGVNIIK